MVADKMVNRSRSFKTFGMNVDRKLKLLSTGKLVGMYWNHTIGHWGIDYDFMNGSTCLPETCGWYGICEEIEAGIANCSCPPEFVFVNESDHSQGCKHPGIENLTNCSTNPGIAPAALSRPELEVPAFALRQT